MEELAEGGGKYDRFALRLKFEKRAALSALAAAKEIANALAIFGITTLEQTEQRLAGCIDAALIRGGFLIELGAPFADMAPGR